MIEVAARLPFMNDRDLGRVFGDHLGKITLGFEVEVAVDPEAVVPLNTEADARAQFFATYESDTDFGTWLSRGSPERTFQDYQMEPRYGWAKNPRAFGPDVEALWTALGQRPFDNFLPLAPEFEPESLMAQARGLANHGVLELTEFGGVRRWIVGNSRVQPFVDLIVLSVRVAAPWNKRQTGSAMAAAIRARRTIERTTFVQLGARPPEPSDIIDGLGAILNEHLDEGTLDQFVTDVAATIQLGIGILTEYAYTNDHIMNSSVSDRDGVTVRRAFESIVSPSDLLDHPLIKIARNGLAMLTFNWQRHEEEERELAFTAYQRRTGDGQASAEADAVAHVATLFARHQPGTPYITGAYHGGAKKEKRTRIEADESISPKGAEIVGPAQSLAHSMSWLADQFKMIEAEASLFTNGSTGLHANIGTWKHEFRTQGKIGVLPNSIDVLKLMIFVGDRAHLSAFGRLHNNYTRPMLESVRRTLVAQRMGGTDDYAINRFIEQANISLIGMADDARYMSVNLRNLRSHGYVEFRIMGGEDYHLRYADVRRTTMRFAQVCMVAADPALYRRQYLIGLYKAMTHANPVVRNLTDKTYRPIFRAFLVKNAPALLAAIPALHETGVTVNHVPKLVEEAFSYDTYGSRIDINSSEILRDYLTGLALVLDRQSSDKLKTLLWRYALQGLGWHGDPSLVDAHRIDLRTRDWAQEAENGVL